MPHRVATYRRYKISDDVLILILLKLDPIPLSRVCQAFQRAYFLVMKFQPLRYVFELSCFGMKDGPAPHTLRPSFTRLQLLMAYEAEWPRLNWSNEQKVKVPATSAHIDISGGFLYYTGDQSINLLELPSCRTGRPPSHTRHLKFNTAPQADSVAIDASQSLIITGQTAMAQNGQIALRLKIRNLWSFEKHPNTPAPYFDCETQASLPVANMFIAVSGNRIVTSLNFVDGLARHLILDWHTFRATWFDDLDVSLLNSNRLLGVKRSQAKLSLVLYNVSDISHIMVEREYELPPIWMRSNMKFGQNSAPKNDVSIPPTALFYPDPEARMMLLSASQTGAPTHWLLISETFFRATAHSDRRLVPWTFWSQFCLIKEFPIGSFVGTPQVVGSHITYLEKDIRGGRGGVERSRLGLLDFASHNTGTVPLSKSWTMIGKMAPITPKENFREFPSATTNGLPVKKICATEDNIIVILEKHGDIQPVNVLTFGVPVPRSTHNGHHPHQF
ncbi:hypothetical protein D9613_006999 [Agrocybe pediades]|uniref:F-box domain-containing protein n=1 Tax=Agrocybe pediades TaxID=84607 RepID=A0A8H4VIS8_9AGAR|nr:hypothetical protein D9613_006999 [Agrocybe pediades]